MHKFSRLRKETLTSTGIIASESAVVDKHQDRARDNLEITPQRPAIAIFEIGFEPLCKVFLALGRAAQPANLGEPGQPGLDRQPADGPGSEFAQGLSAWRSQ